MATHSSVPAWRIPGMGESGGLPSLGSVWHVRSTHTYLLNLTELQIFIAANRIVAKTEVLVFVVCMF